MAETPNRFSQPSSTYGPRLRSNHGSAQVSTQTLLNALNTCYHSGQPYALEASTSLVVNTWQTALGVGPDGRHGGTVDVELARRAWEHARRRAEDGCVVLSSLHQSTPSLLASFISALPLTVPSTFYTALSVLRPFLHCVSPQNPATARHSSLAATFTLSAEGLLAGASLGLSSSGIDVSSGLLHIPAESGYRAFDVFYYLLTSVSTPAEREFLRLKAPSTYALLRRSDSYEPPKYLPTADDAAAAEDLRTSLKLIGIKGSSHRSLLSVLTGLLKLGDALGILVDEEVLEETCADVAGLLDLEPDVLFIKCSSLEREVLIGGIYEALVDWIIRKANDAVAEELRRAKLVGFTDSDLQHSGAATPASAQDDADTVSITVLEIGDQHLAKALALRTMFDDNAGINAELMEDGIGFEPAGHSILKEMQAATSECAPDLGILGGPAARERDVERDRRAATLEKISQELEDGSFLKRLICPVANEGVKVGSAGRFDLPTLLGSSRVWFHLCLHPTDDKPASLTHGSWSAGPVSSQLRDWRLPEWANRRNRSLDFTADFDIEEFAKTYSRLGCKGGKDGVESWILERGWSNGEVVVGHDRVWMREGAWWEAESMRDLKLVEDMQNQAPAGVEGGYSVLSPGLGSGFFGPQLSDERGMYESRDNLMQRNRSSATLVPRNGPGALNAATTARTVSGGDYGLGIKGDDLKGAISYYGELDPEIGEPKLVTELPISKSRRAWVAVVWTLTFWIPSPLLRYVGRMKRPDVRMAWREKLVLMMIIFLLNAFIVFYIIEFGLLLCPNYNKAWSQKEVSQHQGDNDFWVSVRGQVYDISKFWRIQHSDTAIKTTAANMQPFAGMNLDEYFPVPLTVGCPGLVTDPNIQLQANTTVDYPEGLHTSGPTFQSDPTTALHSINWYRDSFLPRIQEYHKGDLVVAQNTLYSQGQTENHEWFIINGKIYDLTDYFYTKALENNLASYSFLGSEIEQIVTNAPGTDITNAYYSSLNSTFAQNALNCLNNVFYVGKPDFRQTARCQVNNYLLLAFTIILCTVILTKFLAALQLGSKRRPAAQDKFVICQVPAYTEGEDQLRKGLDSLTALAYDNKRKLLCVICDGMIVGGGNDRPTPKIVLDILGVDPKIDPPVLPFKSVGQGSDQLNYGKVYSGLYEYEGNVVPYIVVVKVGKESEQRKAKPGNRGKRDSQILLMSFLNRVHYRSPMSPLELEMFHQINNIIGVDPELYEYLFMVDADTQVREDSLNRLVASCANDAKIAGICGETSLENEERSWWTMIQVYEYYISHHLAKAFESLFGSVTCLPGCFSMYRLRTADKGRPLIISDKVIDEYSFGDVDTLHKKNLLSLGEDRYLTTLMTKHFPAMHYKFIPDAYAQTAAPETWSVLLSQRRRWINSTIHNLAELIFLKDMCGFCCFSMRFVVFIDLFGTVILPATCAYLVYLIVRVATHSGQFPLISIIMLGSVYGLQATIFIIKRQWQHVGWMIIYILAFPIYSFVLPIYSFWKQDDFSWGNTRIVIGEKGNKQLVAIGNDEGFDPKSIPLQRWDDYAAANNLPGRRGLPVFAEKGLHQGYDDGHYEMDDMRSVYSSVKPASTVVTDYPNQGSAYIPPRSPAPFSQLRQSGYSNFSRYTDQAGHQEQGRLMSMGGMSDQLQHQGPYSLRPSVQAFPSSDSSANLLSNFQSPPYHRSPSPLSPYAQPQRSPYGQSPGVSAVYGQTPSRPISTVNFQTDPQHGPNEESILAAVREVLREVDMESVTKKQVKAMVEQRLQTQLVGDRRAFLDSSIDTELAQM